MEEKETQKDLPPFVNSWKQFYYFLVFWLLLLIAIFYGFTKYFE